MRRVVFGVSVAAALAIASVAAATPPPTPIVYEISPVFEAGALKEIAVALRFQTDASGVTRLELPHRNMSRSELWRGLRGLGAEGARLEGDGAERVVRSKPGARVTVRYRIVSSLDHEPTDTDGYPEAPWIRPDWFFIDGASALATVEGGEATATTLVWRNWPAGFGHASNLDGRTGFDPTRGLLIGGRDLRVVSHGPVRLAIRGRHAFADATLAADLAGIVAVERAFFRDDPTTPYFVAASSSAPGAAQAFSGVGKDDAFAMIATQGMTLADLRAYLAHEIFHGWNPVRLGRPIGPEGYWISEGFTDFYARRLMRRAGLTSSARFADAWNDMFRAYGVSSARTMGGPEVAKAFWSDPDAEKIPYQRGAMLAALWDWRLRQEGKSLDAVIRAQAEAFREQPDAPLTDLFVATMAKAGVDVGADVARYIDRGEAIDLPSAVFAPCGTLETVTAPSFELGFEPRPGADGLLTVTAIKPDSAAFRAGLRDGMVIARKISGVSGDSTRPYDLIVRSADGERRVNFLPRGAGTARYQTLTLDPAAPATACDFLDG